MSVQRPSGVLTRYATHRESDAFLEDDQQLRKVHPKGQTELQETSTTTSHIFLCFSRKSAELLLIKEKTFSFQVAELPHFILITIKSSTND